MNNKTNIHNICEDINQYNCRIGGYGVTINDKEFKIHGFKTIDVLTIPHSAVSLRVFEKSICDDADETIDLCNNFFLEDNVIYYQVICGDYFWLFGEVLHAEQLFSMIFTAMLNGVKNKISTTNIKVTTIIED